jgi:hypothetical protein
MPFRLRRNKRAIRVHQAETSHARACARGFLLAGRCPKGVPHWGRTVDTKHAERLVSGDETKKSSTSVLWCVDTTG